MKKLYCIACPIGCELTVNGAGSSMLVLGNKCKKGEEFAKSESANPTRVLTTTVRTNFPEVPVIPVRTDGEIPRSLLMKAMHELADVVVEQELTCGDVVVENLLGLGVPVIITSGLLTKLGAELENRNIQHSGNITAGPGNPVVETMPDVTTGDDEQNDGSDEPHFRMRGRSHIRR